MACANRDLCSPRRDYFIYDTDNISLMVEKTRQYYKNSKKWRDHETQIAIINAFAADPELKYWLGAAGSAGAAAFTSYFKIGDDGETPTDPINQGINLYESLLGIGSPLLSAAGVFDFNKDGEGGFAGNVFTFAFTSFAAFNMTCLFLRNASGGQEGKGMLTSLVGKL